ncbi:MAG TPA: HigA family addiction module antitoxin [Stellaceae bacterium]|nr:HigA family addiction module antitoxin [Stellaceae bacterium]
MIVSFRDDWLRAFFVEDMRSRNIPSDLESRLFRKLQMIDDATTDQDLRVPPSNHFEKLRGNLAGFHSIRVNSQWRLVFRWDGGRGEAKGRLSRRSQLQMRRTMLMTKRKPATVGEVLVEEFMRPMGLTQAALAEAMGVQRKHVNELCNNRRNVTAATALILARVFGNSPDFWLNVQRRSDLWEAMNSPRERERIERAKPIGAAA